MIQIRKLVVLLAAVVATPHTLLAQSVQLQPLGTYAAGAFDESAAEIVAHDPLTQRLFVTNGFLGGVDILDIANPAAPTKVGFIDIVGQSLGDAPTSVSFHGGVLAVAVPAVPKTDPGKVVFTDAFGVLLGTAPAGALPDMVTFTPDGTKVVTADEGEPNDGYDIDPQGSITIIDLSQGVGNATSTTVGFGDWDGKEEVLRARGIRIFGPGASASQDLEPEYVAVSADSQTAWVSLQENNAIAIVDLAAAKVRKLVALGYKNHRTPGNGLDPSNRDGAIAIATHPVRGMYQPDTLVAFEQDGKTYLLSANEGDARDYDGFSEEARIKDLNLGNGLLAAYPGLQDDAVLGRLNSTTEPPSGKFYQNGVVEFRKLYAYGARSFSIWNAAGAQLFDSGDQFEQITAALLPDEFNSTDDENGSFDNRSDDKGPEPEAAAVGSIDGVQYAFIGLERIGGIMVYNLSNPVKPTFAGYFNNRDFTGNAQAGTAGDLAPEGIVFIQAVDSPTNSPLLAVANEVSGTTTIFAISIQ